LHSGGIFDRVGNRERELGGDAPPAICVKWKWRTSASAYRKAHQQSGAWCVEPGASATAATSGLCFGADKQRRIGGD
jgi:hypothetical protein